MLWFLQNLRKARFLFSYVYYGPKLEAEVKKFVKNVQGIYETQHTKTSVLNAKLTFFVFL